ncbi:MAG: hypothetical protein AAGK04_13890, partial [Planctomycetota bacterium]
MRGISRWPIGTRRRREVYRRPSRSLHEPPGRPEVRTSIMAPIQRETNMPDARTPRARTRIARAGLVTRSALLGLVGVTWFGCSTVWVDNPAFPVTRESVRQEISRLREAEPVALERPVLILSGYRAAPSMASRLADRLALMTGAPRDEFFTIAYTFGSNMPRILEQASRKIERRYPSGDPEATVELDVIGISMGGLIGRALAMEGGSAMHEGKRLNIRRLYTLGTPHRGALLAER